MPATTLADVVGYVLTEAGEPDLAQILDAYRQRRKTLATAAAGRIAVGSEVELTNFKPKLLNGLTGKVIDIDAGLAIVELDETSTNLLRFRSKKDRVPDGARTHMMRLPLTGLRLVTS